MRPLRTYGYATLNGKEYPMSTNYKVLISESSDDKKNGFVDKNGFDGSLYYILPITPDKVESAYHVETWCAIDGFELRIMNFLHGYYCLQVDSAKKEMLEHFGVIFNSRDFLSLNIKRTEEQVPDIWEVHKAIEGFPFKGPDWVILKFEGKWME